jgi:hypothetical protein
VLVWKNYLIYREKERKERKWMEKTRLTTPNMEVNDVKGFFDIDITEW